MSSSLSKLADNLSEIYSKKFSYENCKSVCEFRGLQKTKFTYNCKGCRKEPLKPINGLIKKFQNTYKL